MRDSTNEHAPQALTRSSPRYLWGLIFLLLVGLGGGSLWYGQAQVPRIGGDRPLEQLGNFGVVPEFTLIERSKRRITRNDLLGRVWVVNFFYASCLDTCPLQSAEMANLQRDLADAPDVRLVSISIDPGPPPSRHRQARYLTLPPALLSEFRAMVAPTAALAHGGIAHQPMLHSGRFVLVDRQARLRGYYHSDEKAALRRLRRDLRTVLREPSVKG